MTKEEAKKLMRECIIEYFLEGACPNGLFESDEKTYEPYDKGEMDNTLFYEVIKEIIQELKVKS